MKKAIFAVSMLFLLSPICFASELMEQTLSDIDHNKQSASKFLSIINTIKEYSPDLTNDDVGNYIGYAYQQIHDKLPDVSLYEVAYDLKEMMIGGNGSSMKLKLNEVVAIYIQLKPKGLI